MHLLHYSLRLAVHQRLRAGHSARAVARELHLSRCAVSRIRRHGPGTGCQPPSYLSLDTIVWAIAAHYDGQSAPWIKRALGLTADQFERAFELGMLPVVICPICRSTVRGLCLSCFLTRRHRSRHRTEG